MADFDWNAALGHPLTVLGAGMMQAGDPLRSGLGGIGTGILNTNQVMQQRAQLEQERQNARDLANIQMMTFQAKQAQLQREQQAREALAAQQGFSPMQQAAIRAGLEQEVVKSALAPEKVSNAMRVYQEAGGMQGTGMDFFEFLQSEAAPGGGVTVNYGEQIKPPPAVAGKQVVRNEDGTFRYEDVPGYEPEALKKIRAESDFTNKRISRVEDLIEQYGTEPLPGGGQSSMSSAVEALKLQVKNLTELGVLSGNDEQIIYNMIGNPVELSAGIRGSESYKQKLQETRRYINDRVASYSAVYGRSQAAGGQDTGQGTRQTPPPPPGFVED